MELRRSVIGGETCAWPAITADRTALEPTRRPTARAAGVPPGPSAGLPPPTHQRPDRLRPKCCSSCASVCSCRAITDTTCSATTIRNRRDEWIRLGIFTRLKQVVLASYDRIVALVLDQIAVDGSIPKASCGGEAAARSPVDRGKQCLKRSGMTDGHGIPQRRVLTGANRHDSPSAHCSLLAARPDPGPLGRRRTAARRHHRPPGRRLERRTTVIGAASTSPTAPSPYVA